MGNDYLRNMRKSTTITRGVSQQLNGGNTPPFILIKSRSVDNRINNLMSVVQTLHRNQCDQKNQMDRG